MTVMGRIQCLAEHVNYMVAEITNAVPPKLCKIGIKMRVMIMTIRDGGYHVW